MNSTRTVLGTLMTCCACISTANMFDYLPLQSHLAPWKAVTLNFSAAPHAGIESFSLFVPVPPNTSTQKNSDYQVLFQPKGAKSDIAEGTVKSHIVNFNSSEGLIPVAHYVWIKSKNSKDDPSGNALAKGFTCQVNMYSEQYYQTLPSKPGSESAGTNPGPSWCANPNDPAISGFFQNVRGNNNLDLVADMINRIGGLAYGGSHSASETVTGGGDCGGKSNLFATGCRLFNIPARVNVGWAIYESGKIEIHAKPEFMLNGWWIFAEPTWYRTNMPVESVLGVNGVKAPHLFTMHRGMYLTHGVKGDGTDPDEKDPYGNPVGVFGRKNNFVSLQTPMMFVRFTDGARVQLDLNNATIRW